MVCVLCKPRVRSETKLIVRWAKSACRITLDSEVSVRSGTSSSRKVTLSRNYCIFEFCPKGPAQANICQNTVNCTSKWRRRCFRGRQSWGARFVLRNNWGKAKHVRKTCDFTGSGVTSDTPPAQAHRLRFFKNFFCKSIFGFVYLPKPAPSTGKWRLRTFYFFSSLPPKP